MPTLSQVHRPKPTEASFDLGDGFTLEFVFDRNAVTPAWIAETDRQAKDNNDVFALAAGLAAVIESWNITEEDGVTYVPVTREAIGALSFGVVGGLVDAVITASSPSRAEGNASSGLSSTEPLASEAQNGTSPGGPATSPSPAPLASPSLT